MQPLERKRIKVSLKKIFNPNKMVVSVKTDGAKVIGFGLGIAAIVLLGWEVKAVLLGVCFIVFGFITRLK